MCGSLRGSKKHKTLTGTQPECLKVMVVTAMFAVVEKRSVTTEGSGFQATQMKFLRSAIRIIERKRI
jgi:hypothetical protein